MPQWRFHPADLKDNTVTRKESISPRFVLAHAVREAYASGEEDESLEPLVLVDEQARPVGRIQNGDYVIFYNIRGEREVELTRSFVDRGFREFRAQKDLHANFATMIQYDEQLKVKVAFPPLGQIEHTLSQVVSEHELRQVKITTMQTPAWNLRMPFRSIPSLPRVTICSG